jgi:hypothetical protein
MAREITAPKPGEPKPFPLRVPNDLAVELHAYCRALPAQWTMVICKAVRELIHRDLEENLGFRRRFREELERVRQEERSTPKASGSESLRLVEPPRKGRGKRSVRRPKGPV